ncbi:MAG: diphthamide synthesis protein, partial [Nitrosopumilaceae archaeon]|nr:diphthamide synthesis protein [Nitrosopumilaceae archaeon]
MIVIDEEKIFDEIKKRRPVSVALNGPDGILPKIQQTASNIMKRFGIPAYVLADTTWGSCDLNSNGAKVLGAEVLFNNGHTISMEIMDDNVVMIDAFDDILFDSVAPKCVDILKGKTICLLTDSQHLHQIEPVKRILEDGGIIVKIGKGK